MYTNTFKRFAGVFLCLFLLGAMVGTASAVTDVYLRAEATTLSLPDGLGGTTSVPVWGFAQDSDFATSLDGTVSVPGPVLTVPPGETVLVVHMDNNLSEPISLNINGLMLTNNGGPVWSELGSSASAFTGSRPVGPPGNYTARVRSFSHETPAGNTADVTYQFNLRPGTYLYASGTNPAKQVQMGLYGALKIDVSVGQAYPGVFYNKDLVLVYSEIDPAINTAIDDGTYGAVAGATITSSVNRAPKYFLVNGMAYEPGSGLDQVLLADPFDKVLVRMINAGYQVHAPQLLNTYVSVVAEDGTPYAYTKSRYGVELPAGKTIDAVLTAPTNNGRFSIHDAALHLTNNGSEAIGGMLAYFDVACAGDFNHDGAVNFVDLGILRSNFFAPCAPGVPCPGNINNDGSVNFVDLGLLRSNFFRPGCPVPAP